MYVVGLNAPKGCLRIKKGDVRKSGDKVPETSKWKQNVLSAHLSLKWICTEEEYKLGLIEQQRKHRAHRKWKHMRDVGKGRAKLKDFKEDDSDDDDSQDSDELDKMPVVELRAIGKELGVKLGGKKIEIIERIRAARTANDAGPDGDEDSDEDPKDDPEGDGKSETVSTETEGGDSGDGDESQDAEVLDEVALEKMTVKELKAVAKEQGLTQSGTKGDLIDRILESGEAEADSQ